MSPKVVRGELNFYLSMVRLAMIGGYGKCRVCRTERVSQQQR